MAVIARAEVTLTVSVDVQKVETWYKLQSSTAQAPTKPTAASPSGWSKTEPGYDGTSTNTLYTCQCTTLTDGTFLWGDVCVSSSYEAAKQAANDAAAAAGTAAAAEGAVDSAVETLGGSIGTLAGDIGTLQDVVDGKASKDDLAALADDTVRAGDDRLKWLSATDDALEVGREDTGGTRYYGRFTADGIGFMAGSDEVASLTREDGLAASKATISKELHLGGWMLAPQDNGNIALKYVGG